MRYLKFFLILFLIPLFAEEKQTDDHPKSHLEAQVDQKTEEKKEGTPLPVEEIPSSVDMSKATESYETAFIKTIVVLVCLLVLVALTIWMFRKISNGRLRNFNYHKAVKILEKRPLSPKSMLYLIEVGGKQVLIAESQLEVRTVTTLDWLGSDKDL